MNTTAQTVSGEVVVGSIFFGIAFLYAIVGFITYYNDKKDGAKETLDSVLAKIMAWPFISMF
jgi:hypothetical protein